MNDSIMVASGVPDKNGDRHASIIASMALSVLVNTNLRSIKLYVHNIICNFIVILKEHLTYIQFIILSYIFCFFILNLDIFFFHDYT